MNDMQLHSDALTHASICLGMCYRRTFKTLYDELIACQRFSKCVHLSFCNFILSSVFVEIYCIIKYLTNKHISVFNTQKHLSSADAEQWSR